MNILFSMGRKYRRGQVPFETSESHLGASAAGHDAQYLGYMLPTTMVFVQSKGGLSHCEEEYSSPQQCTEGASVMLNAVLMADGNM